MPEPGDEILIGASTWRVIDAAERQSAGTVFAVSCLIRRA